MKGFRGKQHMFKFSDNQLPAEFRVVHTFTQYVLYHHPHIKKNL